MPQDKRALDRALEHHGAGRLDEAEALFKRVISGDPHNAAALHGLGIIALQRGDVATALDLLEEASERQPSNAVFLSNLSAAFNRAGLNERARECAERAVQLDPKFSGAHANLGQASSALGEPARAASSYEMALALEPSPQNRLNAGLMRLMHGDYTRGLPLYEARLEVDGSGDTARMRRALAHVPRWRGDTLEGRRILVWTEQGLGDSIMMLRYLPAVRARGAQRIAVCCETALTRLVESMNVADEVFSEVDRTDWAKQFDVQCPMMSLPLAFGTTLATIPAQTGYLHVPDGLADACSRALDLVGRPRIGLVWAGGKLSAADSRRSVTLADFAPVLAVRGVSFVSLQKGPEASQLKRSRWKVHDPMEECADLLDTAALISALDLVISVDTAVAHLAAALGKPTWLLNRRSSEWRWLLDRLDSPWYPTLRVFRQRDADWRAVMTDIAEAVRKDVAPKQRLMGRIGALLGTKR